MKYLAYLSMFCILISASALVQAGNSDGRHAGGVIVDSDQGSFLSLSHELGKKSFEENFKHSSFEKEAGQYFQQNYGHENKWRYSSYIGNADWKSKFIKADDLQKWNRKFEHDSWRDGFNQQYKNWDDGGYHHFCRDPNTTPVPEPKSGTMMLVGAALIFLVMRHARMIAK